MVLDVFNWFKTCLVVGFCVQNNASVIHPALQLHEWLCNKMNCNILQTKISLTTELNNIQLYSFFNLGTRCYPRDRPSTHWTGGWMGPRASLNRCRISCLHLVLQYPKIIILEQNYKEDWSWWTNIMMIVKTIKIQSTKDKHQSHITYNTYLARVIISLLINIQPFPPIQLFIYCNISTHSCPLTGTSLVCQIYILQRLGVSQ
jgi:hypothetical protein